MNQKSSLPQSAKSVSEVLTPGTEGHYYADAPVRRRKSLAELIEGHEYFEIADRAATRSRN